MIEKNKNELIQMAPAWVIFVALAFLYFLTQHQMVANVDGCREVMSKSDDLRSQLMCGEILLVTSPVLLFSSLSGTLLAVLSGIIFSKVISDGSRISSLESELNKLKERLNA
jgi:hypothetical protein